MKIGHFRLPFRRDSKPLPSELVTALSRLDEVISSVDERLVAMEANVKETRQRLETVYRKVYRDIEKGDGQKEEVPPPVAKIIRPGDPLE